MANYRRIARRKARKYNINPRYFVRQIDAESGFNPNAVSPAGARGIAQIMPATAQGWGVNPDRPKAALDAAAKNMAGYLKSYKGDWRKALAAYNAGPGAVAQYGGVPPYAETQAYVKKILAGGSPRERGSGSGRKASTRSVTTRTPRVDNSALRQSLKLGYLDERGDPDALLRLATGLQGAKNVPGRSVTRTTRTTRSNGSERGPKGGGRRAVRKGDGKIYEVFHDPLGEYFDSGKVVKGAIGGHGGHVHVSADPRVALRLGREAQRRGLAVRENPFFDPVGPVHTGGSFHYKSKRIRRRDGGMSRRKVGYAIDVSGGTAEQRAEFARDMLWLAKRHG